MKNDYLLKEYIQTLIILGEELIYYQRLWYKSVEETTFFEDTKQLIDEFVEKIYLKIPESSLLYSKYSNSGFITAYSDKNVVDDVEKIIINTKIENITLRYLCSSSTISKIVAHININTSYHYVSSEIVVYIDLNSILKNLENIENGRVYKSN